MAKLIKILAASVGGGLVLGAGIRLGEAIARWEPAADGEASAKLADRLAALEGRLQHIEAGPRRSNFSQLDPEAAPRSEGATRSECAAHGDAPRTQSSPTGNLRNEVQKWLEENVATRMAEIETRLRAESERGQQQMLDAVVESVQTRVIQRITLLETEVAGQSAAMNELRECSLRTERSVQKLLGGLGGLILKQEADTPAEPRKGTGVQLSESAAPTTEESQPPSSGWRVFR